MELQNISEFCLKCRYCVPENYQKGSISLENARKTCANCKFGKVGIYKFDIVYTLFQTVNTKLGSAIWLHNKTAVVRPTGKKETYIRRYGSAVANLQSEGKSLREIAKILGISPTSVTKISKYLRSDLSDKP